MHGIKQESCDPPSEIDNDLDCLTFKSIKILRSCSHA